MKIGDPVVCVHTGETAVIDRIGTSCDADAVRVRYAPTVLSPAKYGADGVCVTPEVTHTRYEWHDMSEVIQGECNENA